MKTSSTLLAEAASARVAPTVEPRIERDGIRFRNLTFERVQIELELTNPADVPSTPTIVRVDAAPFGAFLPWRGLTLQPAPAIAPGGTARIVFEARRPRVAPVGSFSDSPPDGLGAIATAAGAGDSWVDRSANLAALLNLMRPSRGKPSARRMRKMILRMSRDMGLLPADLFDLLGRGGPHWVGNLNVFIGKRAVERHKAPALRVYSGRLNFSMFALGDGPDEYRFELAGSATAWKVCLRTRLSARSHARGPGAVELAPGRWHSFDGKAWIGVNMVPPEWAERGSLEVRVCQRSTGRRTAVEFELDPAAAGPGCYTV